MRIVPVLLLGFFVCNSIKTWDMNMYFGTHNGFKMLMKLQWNLCITIILQRGDTLGPYLLYTQVQIGCKGRFLSESSM